jgi:hypothetical protein
VKPKPAVIWDLCQTLFDTQHRLHWILKKPANWAEFDKRTMYDKVIPAAKLIYCAFMARGIDQIIITGRGERTRDMCDLLMMKNGLLHSGMYMRPEGPEIPSTELKRRLLAQARKDGWHPIMAFEDQPDTVSMYRVEGVHCWAADDSNWKNGKSREVSREPINDKNS